MPPNQEDSVEDAELTIPKLRMPSFTEHIEAEDVKNLHERDVKILLKLSRIAQQVDFLCAHVAQDNLYQREMERRLLRLTKWKMNFSSKTKWIMGAVVLVATALTTGLIGAVCKAAVEHLFSLK